MTVTITGQIEQAESIGQRMGAALDHIASAYGPGRADPDLRLAAGTPVAPEAMGAPGLPVPDDKTAVAMFTAHRLHEALYHLAHASERMKAARAADGDLRAYHSARSHRHLQHALEAGHGLTANIREHYPAEAAELKQVKQAIGLAGGYKLNPRSAMISLDLPSGTVTPVPGGVDDHHITVIYLGPDVDDDAFAQACDRAREAAAAMPGPLTGTVSGIGTFKPSAGSDGKVPAWAGVVLPGAERLRSALEDLSASEHKDWKPHVTLAYVVPGEALPSPVPQTPVTFTHLSVHRGDHEAKRFPLGGPATGLAADGGISARVVGLAKSLTPEVKSATTAHLLETTLHEMTHGVRHAQAILETNPDDVWEFNADHAEKHLGGAVEHAGKLVRHFRDNYPDEGRFLDGLDEATAPAQEESGAGKQHARYAGSGAQLATISAQALDAAPTISGQVELAEARPFERVTQIDPPKVSATSADGHHGLSPEMVPEFLDLLKAKGVALTYEHVPPGLSEQATGVNGTGHRAAKPVLVSSDDRVIGGGSLAPGVLVIRVGLPAEHLLEEVRRFARGR